MSVQKINANKIPGIHDKNTSLILIDVREEDEFFSVSSPYARNFPLSSLDVEEVLKSLRLNLFETEVSLYFICQTGRRSLIAAEKLFQDGYKNIYNIEGGMVRWQELKLPVHHNKKIKE